MPGPCPAGRMPFGRDQPLPSRGQRAPPGSTTPGCIPTRRGGHPLLLATLTMAASAYAGGASPPSSVGAVPGMGRR